MKTLPNNSVDMVLTDVPYNNVNRSSGGLRNLDKGIADSAVFSMETLCLELKRLVSGSVYVFCEFDQISPLNILLKGQGFSTRIGVWNKTNPSPMNGKRLWLSGLEFCVFARKAKAVFNEHCKNPLWTFASQQSKIHDTQKPVKLFQHLVEASSRPGMLIMDCFAGSGTTAIVSENTDRRWICVEKDETYANKAIERIKNRVLAGLMS